MDNNCRLLYTGLQPKAGELLSVIGRNKQQEENGCENQVALLFSGLLCAEAGME